MDTDNFIKKPLIMLSSVFLVTAGIAGCCGHHHSPRDSRPPQSHGDFQKGPGGPGGSRMGPPPSPEQLLAEFDKNGDGKLSKTEFPGPDEHFTRLDKNQDGYIEKDEIPDGPPPRENRN